MDPKQKQTLSEINSPQLLTPEFIKGCIKIINCNTRLGEVEPAKDAINMTSNLGSIPGVSALCQVLAWHILNKNYYYQQNVLDLLIMYFLFVFL